MHNLPTIRLAETARWYAHDSGIFPFQGPAEHAASRRLHDPAGPRRLEVQANYEAAGAAQPPSGTVILIK